MKLLSLCLILGCPAIVLLLAGCNSSDPASATGRDKEADNNASPPADPKKGAKRAAAPKSFRRVVLVTIDGMVPQSYLDPDSHGLRVPVLRRFAKEGAFSSGARSVFPTVTYPSHTTIATGQPPALHGVTTNRTLDPLARNLGGWYWYAEDLKAATLWDRAKAAGRTVATVNWPVTVGAELDFNVPEYWRAGTADDVKLARALTHPRGMLEKVASAYPNFEKNFTPPDVRDSATGDIADYLIRTHKPELLMAHMWWVDEMQHQHGLWSKEAVAAIEEADKQIGRLIEATRAAGVADNTVFIVASDHGFAAIQKEVSPGAMLAAAGFVDVSEGKAGKAEKVTSWRATASVDGGISLIYVDGNKPELIAAVTKLFTAHAERPEKSGILRVISAPQIKIAGGDSSAALAIEAAPGFAFRRGHTGPAVLPSTSVATHGFDPARADMHASLLIWGAGIKPTSLGSTDLTDIAPTAAALLRLPKAPTAGVDRLAK